MDTCPDALQFQCKSGECIDFLKECDCADDCIDQSDEDPELCAGLMYDKFVCANGDCVSISSRCNCYKDCPDGSNESRCNEKSCTQCDSGSSSYPSYGRCDCLEDCLDKSDEADCEDDQYNQRFLCDDGQCIPDTARCDSIVDCKDRSDEKNCGSGLLRFKIYRYQPVCQRKYHCSFKLVHYYNVYG